MIKPCLRGEKLFQVKDLSSPPVFYILMTCAQNWGASWEEPALGVKESLRYFEDTEIKGKRQDSCQ